MPYNSKILAKANARLADIREANAKEHQRRLENVYYRVPEIEAIDSRLRSQMVELARLAFSRREDSQHRILTLKDENLSLQMRRAELLVANGFPRSWLDDIYSCPLCHDTGNADHGICQCLEKLYKQELTAELSSLLRNGDECFDNFNLNLYSDEYSEYFKCVPREYMGRVLQFCREYAQEFPDITDNLLFQGGPGLGKTYLSACIAREVASRGFSVYYDTAVSVFSAFERQQFSRTPEEAEAASEKTRIILSCDLLILDDLGTEVVTPVVSSALYTIINSRINAKKHIIINTTLYPDELAARYTPSICSRLDGFFKHINFAGSDIRHLLKNK